MAFKYSAGSQPIGSIIASIAGGTGLTTFTIASATGLPTIGAGEFGTLRIADGTANAETLTYSLSGTTVTCSPTGFAHSNGDAVAFDIISASALNQIKDDSISGYPENLLTTAGALVKGGGVANRITISTAQTFTLANGTYKGELCRIKIDRTSTNLATIDPAGATTIDGAATRIMWAGESSDLAWTGTEWEKVGGKTVPMTSTIYIAGNAQSLANAVEVVLLLDTVAADNTGLMAVIANNKMTIRRGGDYLLSLSACISTAGNIGTNCGGQIKVAGVNVARTGGSAPANSFTTSTPSRLLPLSIGVDVTATVYQNTGQTSPIIIGGVDMTRLSATEVPNW